MGFDEGRMELDSPNGTYYSGQTVQGKLTFHQDKVKSFRGIFVKLKGFCHVHWTTTRTRTVNGKSQSYTVHHNSHEEYVNTKMYLVGGESGDHSITPGNYEYPFHFRLPPNCPSSFEGQYGHVRYEIKAVVDRAFKFDQEKKVAVRVMAPLDLNLDPYCKEPVEFEFQDSYCCCCFSSGSSEVSVKLPLAGYCPGQTIPIEVSCINKGGVEIDDIKLIITKKVTFIATSEPGTRKDKDKVAEIKKGPIPGNTNRNWTVEMDVPAMDVYNLTGCQYINLEYKFKVVVSPEGCHSDSDQSRRIVIGTIPLVGFQDNIQNPLHDQMPQQMAVTQQPMLAPFPPMVNTYPEGVPEPMNQPYPGSQPYPGNSPYPPANPYPNPNQPSPYPPNNAPYPPSNTPYPPTSSSYAPTSSPYPSANPPYPNVTPYRDNPPPYPGNMSNPDPNPPYPAEKQPLLTEKLVNSSPYDGGNPPTSGANPPYPGANPPYPVVNPPNSGGNPPYPIVNPPNSGANPPYPSANPPNSGGNPPYPGANPPNSGANPPYPGANPPYPVTGSPYPPEMAPIETKSSPNPGSVGGLRTGKLGFTVPSGGTGMMPPLPPSSSPRPTSPYATASAPAPDSPADALPEKKG